MDNQRLHMDQFMEHFKDMPTRLMKYLEISLLGKDASAFAYQNREDYRVIAIELTTKCNLNCKWCYRRDLPISRLNKEVDFKDLKKLIPQLKGFKKIHLAGLGEILLYPKLAETVKLCKKYVPKVVTTTNATLLTKEMTHKLTEAGLDFLEVSIDSFIGDENKEFRGLPASLEKIHENIKYFSEYSKIPIQINSVVSSINIKSLYNAMEFVKDIPTVVDFHTIKLFMTNYMKNSNISIVSDEEWTKLVEHLKEEAKRLKLNINFTPNIKGIKLDPVITMKKQHNICFIPFEDPSIDVEGNLLPCCRIYEIKLGNVYKEGFDAVWNGEKAQKFRKNMLTGCFPEQCALQCSLKKNISK